MLANRHRIAPMRAPTCRPHVSNRVNAAKNPGYQFPRASLAIMVCPTTPQTCSTKEDLPSRISPSSLTTSAYTKGDSL